MGVFELPFFSKMSFSMNFWGFYWLTNSFNGFLHRLPPFTNLRHMPCEIHTNWLQNGAQWHLAQPRPLGVVLHKLGEFSDFWIYLSGFGSNFGLEAPFYA